MHIPDGYLGPVTYGGLWSVMIPIWAYASRKVKQEFETARIPYLAMASVFSLVAMVFAIPLPGGTTGHLNGSTLVAILLGPWPAILSISVALTIQALIFGEGGVTALAANCFNIAFVGALTGYGVYRFVRAVRLPRPIAGAGAAYLSLNVSGFIMAIELGIQPLIHSDSSSFFPYPLKIALPAVMIPHLTVIGLLEAAVTGVALTILLKGRVKEMKALKKTIPFLLTITLTLFSSFAHGHDFWIEKRGSDLLLVFGHGTKREPFDPLKVKTVKAIGLDGRELEVRTEKGPSGLLLKTDQPPSLLVAEIDHGYWSKTIYGWKNLPKRKASRVVEANRSLFYTKALLAWNEMATKPIEAVRLDLLPLENPFESKAGATLPIKVLYQGRPLSGVEVEGLDHQRYSATDREGIVRIPLRKGFQLVSVSYKEPLKEDPDADYYQLTSTLTFEVSK